MSKETPKQSLEDATNDKQTAVVPPVTISTDSVVVVNASGYIIDNLKVHKTDGQMVSGIEAKLPTPVENESATAGQHDGDPLSYVDFCVTDSEPPNIQVCKIREGGITSKSPVDVHWLGRGAAGGTIDVIVIMHSGSAGEQLEGLIRKLRHLVGI